MYTVLHHVYDHIKKMIVERENSVKISLLNAATTTTTTHTYKVINKYVFTVLHSSCLHLHHCRVTCAVNVFDLQ